MPNIPTGDRFVPVPVRSLYWNVGSGLDLTRFACVAHRGHRNSGGGYCTVDIQLGFVARADQT